MEALTLVRLLRDCVYCFLDTVATWLAREALNPTHAGSTPRKSFVWAKWGVGGGWGGGGGLLGGGEMVRNSEKLGTLGKMFCYHNHNMWVFKLISVISINNWDETYTTHFVTFDVFVIFALLLSFACLL